MTEEPAIPAAAAPPVDAAAPATGSALRRRLRPEADQPQGHRHLLTGSGMLVVGAGVQALGGMVFTLIAAHGPGASHVVKDNFGKASALFTSVLFVTYLAGLGLPVALARYSPDRSDDSHTIFTWAVLATLASSVVWAVLYLVVVRPKAAHVLWNWSPVGGTALFAAMVVGSALSLIVDVRWMTMRRWNLVLTRVGVISVLKVALLAVAQPSGGHRALWLFVYFAGPLAVSGVVGVLVVNRSTGGRHRLRPRPRTMRPAVRYSLVNYLSTLAYQAPYFALPVIVLVHVSPSTNSSFYVAWGIVAIAFYVPSAIGQALLAEGGKEGAELRGQVRLAVLLAAAIMGLGSIVAFAGKSVVVAAYGHAYGDAARILPSMMLAGIPWALTSLYLTEARVQHRHVATVVITVTLTVAIIVPALVLVPGHGSRHGINGAAEAWLLGNVAAALVAVVVTWFGRRADAPSRTELDPVLAEGFELPA